MRIKTYENLEPLLYDDAVLAKKFYDKNKKKIKIPIILITNENQYNISKLVFEDVFYKIPIKIIKSKEKENNYHKASYYWYSLISERTKFTQQRKKKIFNYSKNIKRAIKNLYRITKNIIFLAYYTFLAFIHMIFITNK